MIVWEIENKENKKHSHVQAKTTVSYTKDNNSRDRT